MCINGGYGGFWERKRRIEYLVVGVIVFGIFDFFRVLKGNGDGFAFDLKLVRVVIRDIVF